MRITITDSRGNAMERGNTFDERMAASAFIQANVRCRFTPQSKARAKAFAKAQAN